mmetsp:Transcript_27034/g.65204  ORF Transcript_27034/g.65204 Transcript_27034/m.65204 type:complete len:222 (+) Transcript_27034:468-1133(+)
MTSCQTSLPPARPICSGARRSRATWSQRSRGERPRPASRWSHSPGSSGIAPAPPRRGRQRSHPSSSLPRWPRARRAHPSPLFCNVGRRTHPAPLPRRDRRMTHHLSPLPRGRQRTYPSPPPRRMRRTYPFLPLTSRGRQRAHPSAPPWRLLTSQRLEAVCPLPCPPSGRVVALAAWWQPRWRPQARRPPRRSALPPRGSPRPTKPSAGEVLWREISCPCVA